MQECESIIVSGRANARRNRQASIAAIRQFFAWRLFTEKTVQKPDPKANLFSFHIRHARVVFKK
jgi:hypothetical protein